MYFVEEFFIMPLTREDQWSKSQLSNDPIVLGMTSTHVSRLTSIEAQLNKKDKTINFILPW